MAEAPKHPEKLMIELIAELYGKTCVEVRQSIEAKRLQRKRQLISMNPKEHLA